MSTGKIQRVVESMDPNAAAHELAGVAKQLLSMLGEEALRDFLTNLLGSEGEGKKSGLVHF